MRTLALASEEGAGVEDSTSASTLTKRLVSLWQTLGQSDLESFTAELDSLSQLSVWKASKVDVLIHHELFNLIDDLLQAVQGAPDHIVMRAIKFVKVTLIYATSAHYFSSSEVSCPIRLCSESSASTSTMMRLGIFRCSAR